MGALHTTRIALAEILKIVKTLGAEVAILCKPLYAKNNINEIKNDTDIKVK